MEKLDRLTMDPEVRGGKPCIRGMRVTVGTLVGFMTSGKTIDEVAEPVGSGRHSDPAVEDGNDSMAANGQES